MTSNQTINGGYFMVARKTFQSEVMSWPPVWFKLWIWLIGKANHAEVRDRGQVFGRGEVLTSYEEMREVASYKVGWRIVKPTKTQIRDFCEALREATMATTRKTTRGFFIKLEKYAEYQTPENYEDHTENPTKTTRRPQTDPTINKNEKNEKNITTKSEVLHGEQPPLTYEDIYQIAKAEGVMPFRVQEKERDVHFEITQNGNTKYKIKSVKLTTWNWVRMGVKSGKIPKLNEMEKLVFPKLSPEWKAQEKIALAKLEAEHPGMI